MLTMYRFFDKYIKRTVYCPEPILSSKTIFFIHDFFGHKYHIWSPKNIKSENNLILGGFGVFEEAQYTLIL